MALMKTIENNTPTNRSYETIELGLDFFGVIESVFSTEKDSRVILYKGASVYDLIHPAYHANFEFYMSSLSELQESVPFDMRIKNKEATVSYPVKVVLTRGNVDYKVKMTRVDIEKRNKYDSSLFIHLDKEVSEELVKEAQAYVGLSPNPSHQKKDYEDVSELLLSVLLQVASKENYIVAKKFPSVLMEKNTGELVIDELFAWFFSKHEEFEGIKEYLIEGEIKDSTLIVSLKYTGQLFTMHQRIQTSDIYKRLIEKVDKLNGVVLNISSERGIAKLIFPLKYNKIS